MYPCQCFHFDSKYCLSDIREKSLEKIVHDQKIKEIINQCFQRPLKITECRECKWRNFCGSGCMGLAFETNGTILHPESCEIRKKWVEKLFTIEFKEIIS